MANNENINLNINVKADESVKSLRQMRQELKDLNAQMDAAAAAGNKPLLQGLQAQFGELKNDIRDLNQEMKFSDSGEFLAGFTRIAKSAVAGFGAVTGAMELFGASTEDVQEVQKKSIVIIQTLQSLEEIRSLLEAKGAIRGLANSAMRILGLTGQVAATEAVAGANVQATATQWSWNAAMAANPIGIVIAGVAALAAGIYALSEVMGDSEIETESYNTNLKDIQDSTRKAYSTIAELKMQLLKKQGKITDEDFNKWKANEENKARLVEIFGERSRKIREAEATYERNWNKITEEGKNLDTVELNKLLNAESEKLAKEKEKINSASNERIKANTKLYLAEVAIIHQDAKEKEVKTEKKAVDKIKIGKLESIKGTYNEAIELEAKFLVEVSKMTDKQLKEAQRVAEGKRTINSEVRNDNLALLDQIQSDNQERDDFFLQLRLNNAETSYEAEQELLDQQYADDLAKYGYTQEQELAITADYEEKKKQLKIQKTKETIDEVNKYTQLASDFVNSLTQMEMANIEEAGENEVGGKERVEREKKAIQKKYAGLNLAIQIAQIGADVARGITSALSLPFPLSLIVGGIYGGIGIAQTAVATRQYQNIMKLKRGGLLMGPSHEQGGINIGGGYEAEGGEAVLNKTSMSIPAYRSLASAINVAGGGVSFGGSKQSAIVSTIDPSIISSIVNQVTSNIVNIPVVISEYDITKMQRKVRVIEQRSTY